MAFKLPPIKKTHIVQLLTFILSLLAGNAAPSFFADEPELAPHCPPAVGSSTDGGVEPAKGTAPLAE